MYKIQIHSWNVVVRNKEETTTHKENLIDAIKFLINTAKQEDLPTGIENFQIMHKLADAFDNFEKLSEKDESILYLENREYTFVRNLMKKNIPAQWGMNKNLSEQINYFLTLQEDD